MALQSTYRWNARGFTSADPELAAIDRAARWPITFCLLSAVHWMVTGTFLLVYALSLRHPEDSIPVQGLLIALSYHAQLFTYGHVWPAALDALVYGWVSTAGFGVAVWLLARIGRTPIRLPAILMTGVVFWNLGVAVGLTALFLGQSRGIELLDFPAYAGGILWLSYALIAVSAIATYLGGKPSQVHLSQGWLLTALFAFPWLFGAGVVLLDAGNLPGGGVMQELIHAWYVHGLYTLWLAPLGLGALYYLIPKISGTPMQFHTRAKFAFWSWIILAPWTAVHDLVGGPFPFILVTLGLVLSGLIFLPVSLIGLNLVPTSVMGEKKNEHGVVVPFLTLAATFFVVAGICEQILSIRTANEVLRFTIFRDANTLLWVYGFSSFVIFGSMYYMVPRLLDYGWRSALLIRIHYYASIYGILLVIVMLGFGGVVQGFILESSDSQVTIQTATGVTLSFLIASTACVSLISIGNGVFALHLGWLLLDWWRTQVRELPTLAEILHEKDDDEPEPAELTLEEARHS